MCSTRCLTSEMLSSTLTEKFHISAWPRILSLCDCCFVIFTFFVGPSSCYKIVKMIMERNFQPVIIFSFSKKECEAYALQMSKLDFNSGELRYIGGVTKLLSFIKHHYQYPYQSGTLQNFRQLLLGLLPSSQVIGPLEEFF